NDGGIFFDPSGAWVVFPKRVAGSVSVLARVPLDGSAPAADIPGTEGATGTVFTPGGERPVFLADRNGDSSRELYSGPFDGSAPAARLDDPSIRAGSVQSFQLSSDGGRVVFLSDRSVQYQFEAFVVPADGSSDPVRLNPALGVQRIVRSLVTQGD